jgi:SRSO17 transposase
LPNNLDRKELFTYASPLAWEWTSTFDGLAQQMRPCFVHHGTWHRMQNYLRGLHSPVERKNGWRIAEAIGAVTPFGVHSVLDRVKWDEDAVRDVLRASVYEALADPQALLILDETGFLKKGTRSVGVQR